MFQRRNSHKLTLDLLTSFKDSFAQLPPYSSEAQVFPATPAHSTPSADEAMNPSQFGDVEDAYDHMYDPDNQAEWKPTDLFDGRSPGNMTLFEGMSTPYQQTPNSSSYYVQNPVHHHQAPPGLITPLSRTVSVSDNVSGMPSFMSMQDFQLHRMPSAYDMGHFDTFSHNPQPLRQPYGHDLGQGSVNPRRLDVPREEDYSSSLSSGDSQLRFRVTLKTGTAMVKDGETPVTYLNKCQPYWLQIHDTRPERQQWSGPTTYRTFIRATFNDQQQRERPAACWQLYKEGRGMSEAQQRGSKLQAVEYVPHDQSAQNATSIELEKQIFDGFCVVWTTSAAQPMCEFQFRCNFLSTDFSHHKGVKGIPLRLCAKTKVLGTGSMAPPSTEICYCKVKLFRDHGSERKIHNDEGAVKKLIGKLEDQIKQSHAEHEEGLTASGKRRRSDSVTMSGRHNKIAKHRRASSVSSNGSSGIGVSIGGDLHSKLASLTRLLYSKRVESTLNLKGEALDDPDKYPLYPEGASSETMSTESPQDRRLSRRSTQLTTVSDDRSPSTSVLSVNSPIRRQQNFQVPMPINASSAPSSNEWPPAIKTENVTDIRSANPQHLASPPDNQANTEQRPSAEVKVGSTNQAIHVLDLDPSYAAPSPRRSTPVACFYILTSTNGKAVSPRLYRAVYLYERSLNAFTRAVALKHGVDPKSVKEVVYIRNRGEGLEASQIQVAVDDDVIFEMAEGQDIEADFVSTEGSDDRTMQQATRGNFTLTLRY